MPPYKDNAMPLHSSSRRTLIKGLAAAGLAGCLPAACAASRKPGKHSLGVALVGLGYYSRELLAPGLQLTRDCHLAGIVTGTPAKALEWQRRYDLSDRNVYDYDDFDRIADNPDIDVVYVVLPNHLHKPFTLRAAAAGKHVWCEKPMAMDAAEAQAMIEACQRNKVKLAIGYRMQHEPNTQRVMGFARARPYGELRSLRCDAGFKGLDDAAGSDNWRLDPARGGGAMYDMGVYSLNAARYTSGEEPVAVTARKSVQRPHIFTQVDESMDFELEFPSGLLARCSTSFGRNMNLLRAEAEHGWYELSPFQAYDGIHGRTSDGLALDARVTHQQAL
ncbi:MAG TPA: Gfo/Idh/MocA family oxidoreductase, partial [Pseudoxanthomonas sp.]|nr:Gfo/Idh/MocA family oxidoreductase [Pseudoxanthomonas sp.]